MDAKFTQRGFLPPDDPVRSFDIFPQLSVLDDLGRDLPSMLESPDFRDILRKTPIPEWPKNEVRPETIGELRLYYVRLGFLASAYVNQVGQPRATLLPRNIAIPLVHATRLLDRPPILSYDGYALYNWKRFDPHGPIALGNIDTLQDFMHLYDEHWFILVHVEIEAIAAEVLMAIGQVETGGAKPEVVNPALERIAKAVWSMVGVLRRIPEKMDPAIYYKTFRQYIRFFENVVYEGIAENPMNYRGETGAQSSIIPTLVAFMKINHQQSMLTNHLRELRGFMPAEHRELIAKVEAMPDIKDIAERDVFNDVLEAMATFRETHYGWAQQYINQWDKDPRGTGGTPYMQWLKQLVDETRLHKK